MFKKKDKEKKEIEVVTEEQANARTVKIMSGFATFAKYFAMLVVETLIMILFIVIRYADTSYICCIRSHNCI